MVEISYNSFVEVLFKSPNVGWRIQRQVIRDFSDDNLGEGRIETLSRHIFRRARVRGYNIVTRFVPPYCSTVTFYKDTLGFVTVSRLGPDFDFRFTHIAGELFVTNGAVTTITQAFLDTIRHNTVQSDVVRQAGRMRHPRDKLAHQEALSHPASGHNPFYIRLEGTDPVIRSASPLRAIHNSSVCRLQCLHTVRILIHRWFMGSKIDFERGPAAVMNDFLYRMHDGRYAANIRITGGELSANLNWRGTAIAFLNLNATNTFVSGVIGLFTSIYRGSYTGILVASLLLISLHVYQMFWTWLVTTTNFDDITSNTLRLRSTGQAAALLGLDEHLLCLLLAMISPHADIHVHGSYNSYVDVAGDGYLEVTGKMPSLAIYLAGYITSSLTSDGPDQCEHEKGEDDEKEEDDVEIRNIYRRLPLAAWVPYDTQRIVYSANDKIRKLSLIDGVLHLSKSSRTSIDWSGRRPFVKHDGGELYLPKGLQVYPGSYVG